MNIRKINYSLTQFFGSRKETKRHFVSKILLKRICLLFLSLTLFNCSNDDDGTVKQPESIRLVNYTIDDVPFNMTYNDDNLLIKYQYGNTFAVNSSIEYDSNGYITKNGSRTFTYNSTGQITTITQILSPTASFVSTIVYNSQGLVESITTDHNNGETGTIQINYNSDNKPLVISEHNASVGSPYAKTTLTYDASGNITRQFIERSNDGISYYDFSTTNYAYDTKKNPFALTISKIGNANNQLFQMFIGMNSVSYGRQVAFDSFYFNSPNNLVSIQDSFKIISFNYTYNANDFPITSEEIYDASSSGGSVNTYNFNFNYETY
jgi:hypothetical protein